MATHERVPDCIALTSFFSSGENRHAFHCTVLPIGGPPRTPKTNVRPSPYTLPSASNSPTKAGASIRTVRFPSLPPSSHTNVGGAGARDLEGRRDELDDGGRSDDDLIAKPEGEVGRPRRGGYNLHHVLGWPTSQYDEIGVSCRHMSAQVAH